MEGRLDIWTIQQLLDHRLMITTRSDTEGLNGGPMGVDSQADH
jgi:hypothetical protein